uniref:GIY-YIG homing endonuclease n=1 Tax=Ophiostoma novo-ulmi subsp. novo-ulmi TaxID=170179 RepID=A0A2L1IPW3_OPHNO|nr:GIY-YIG homing endonuclease [Ophiostoma novo-ulmi subsp. novo-ulmi]
MESKVRMIEANSAYPVYVYNFFKELLVIYPSVTTLAKLIKSNHPTIVNYIKVQTIFRGEWYFSNLPYNINDALLINDWNSKESETLNYKLIRNIGVKQGIFVYNADKNIIGRYKGVTDVQKALNINHSTIKKYAKINGSYNGYIFSYERLKD